MTPKEIADHLLAQTTLTEKTMQPMLAYRREKRATGAPVALEDAIVHAAWECQRSADALRNYLERAWKEAEAALREFNDPSPAPGYTAGVHTSRHWDVLRHDRISAERLNDTLREKRDTLASLLDTWSAVADRIVATDEDRAQAAANRRARAIAAWTAQNMKTLGAACAKAGIRGVTGREAMAAALVDVGVEP